VIVFPDAGTNRQLQGPRRDLLNHGSAAAPVALYVHEKVFDQVVEGVSNVAADIKLASGLDPACQMGPLVSDEQYRKVVGYIDPASLRAPCRRRRHCFRRRARLLCAATVLTNTTQE